MQKMTIRISPRDILDVDRGMHVHPKELLREREYAEKSGS